MQSILNKSYPGTTEILRTLVEPLFGKNAENGFEEILDTNPGYQAQADEASITAVTRIATYSFGVQELHVFDITVARSKNLSRSCVGIQHIVRNIVYNIDAALMFFHTEDNSGDWRISFFTHDAATQERTSAKRLTYVVGEQYSCRTAIDQFHALQETRTAHKALTLEDITAAFSVEALNERFFIEYRNMYADFVEYITGKRYEQKNAKWEEKKIAEPHPQLQTIFHNDEKAVRDFVKKMMGRLVFLQFLQKKGWLGVPQEKKWGEGNKNYLQDLFTSSVHQDNFFYEVLRPLFFETLNKDRKTTAHRIQDVLGKNQKIPYLNGGLFEPEDFDTCAVSFPADHFKRLFAFFEQYNFTIDENDPDEKEIGVDPEMLGRIFENLLEDNKDKGTFYTPKEIVHYMCRESLIAYLSAETDMSDVQLRNFVLHDEVPFTDTEKVCILEKLKTVKICDPAVGSGAFPMGMLKELLRCRQLIGEQATTNEIKKDIVKWNIYGVDIEKGAVDIARLRFWLSIIVDEEEPLPLPNLDYKIMQGNSLIESYQGIDLRSLIHEHRHSDTTGDLFDNVDTLKNLIQSLSGYYETNDHQAKQSIRHHIKEYVLSLLKDRAVTDKKTLDDFEHIKELHENSFFFLWHIWFSEVFNRSSGNNGFDIIISNPPYIQLQEDSGRLSKIYKPLKYESFNSMGDIYQLFYEKGVDLLKEQGHLCYITSNKWMRAGYGKNSRKYFAEHTQPKILIDLAGEKVFKNATVDVNILLLQKTPYTHPTYAIRGGLECLEKKSGSSIPEENGTSIIFPREDSWVILNPIEQRIKEKIEKIGIPLKDWDIKINYGIKTGCNEAFIIDGAKRKELIEQSPNSAEIIRPILRGKDIKRYGYNFNDIYLLFIPWHFPLHENKNIQGVSIEAEKIFQENYPAIYNHLLQYKTQLSNRNKAETGIRYEWYALQRFGSNYMDEFSKQKIVWKRVGSILRFAFDDQGLFVLDSTCFAVGNYAKYLTGILNSSVGKYMLQNSPTTGTGDLLISVQAIEPLKLPIPTEEFRNLLELKVDEIIYNNHNTNMDINKMIYKLYQFSNDEIDFIENTVS